MMARHQSYQRGYISPEIRTRRGKAYIIRYRVRTAEGKWKHKSETLYGLKGIKAARGELAQRIKESSTQRVEITGLTFRNFVEKYWRPYLERNNVKPSTRQSYESALKCHVLPPLGNLRLVDVAPLHIEELLQSSLKCGLSPKTVRNLVGLLQGIFSLAVDEDVLRRSPVREKHKPVVPRREKPVWTPQQLRAIVRAAPELYRSLFACIMLTGVRLGELLGLQWKHVDFANRKLKIEQSLWRGQLVTPKTPESAGKVPIGEVLVNILTQKLRDSKFNDPEDFVFLKPDGSRFDPDVLRRDVLYPTLDRLGIPREPWSAGFHTFRHSAATILNEETHDLKLTQKFLRHSNLGTTADTYTHTSPEAELEAAHALERAIYGELFVNVRKTANKNKSVAVN